MTAFPESFTALHNGEELVRSKSIEAITRSEDLSLHVDAIRKAADLIDHFVHHDAHNSEDELTIRLLGIRLFNSVMATMQLLLSGYYQASTLQQRDLIETTFLLDYFSGQRVLIARWQSIDAKVRRRDFSPDAVRKALDKRDKFTGNKRAQHYALFSDLAAHPSPRGFQMTRLPDGSHHSGPFFDTAALSATLSELGKTTLLAATTFTVFFRGISKRDYQIKLAFVEVQGIWRRTFFGVDGVPEQDLENFRAMIKKLPG